MAYIEREKVIEIAKDEYYSDFHRSMADLISLRELLEDTPTADVVEVVRCKNCNVPHNKWLGCPHLNGLIPPPDFYCAKGTPKERGGEK